ncbi:MAG TPA: DUF2059 domain-containing protein [Sphingobium sp.]
MLTSGTALAAVPEPATASAIDGEGASLAAAVKFVDLLQMERLLDDMVGNLQSLFADNVIAAIERDQTQASYLKTLFENGRGGRERFSAILGEEFRAAMRSKYPTMKNTAAAEYARLFSLRELNELTAFFSTGVGAKWHALSPKVEKSMSQWGERAGMEAGGTALMNALKRADTEMLAKGNSQ